MTILTLGGAIVALGDDAVLGVSIGVRYALCSDVDLRDAQVVSWLCLWPDEDTNPNRRYVGYLRTRVTAVCLFSSA